MRINIDPQSADLHDALIDSMQVDYAKGQLRIELRYYPEGQKSKSRVPLSLEFSGVTSLQHLADFSELVANAFAGHVVFWLPGPVTNIHLTGGIIIIASKQLMCISSNS